jgi:hypothetical protein
VPRSASELIATISRPAGGLWLVWADGGVWALDGAPFYGSYQTLPKSEAMADAAFIGAAFWPGGENGEGYYLVHRDVAPGGGGLYRFDSSFWRESRDSGLALG